MEGQCKERPGVEGTEGGRRERPEQAATTRIVQADHVRENGKEDTIRFKLRWGKDYTLFNNYSIVCGKR